MRIAQWIYSLLLASSFVLLPPAQGQESSSYAALYRQAGLDQQFEFLWQEVSSEYVGLPKRQTKDSNEQTVLSLIESTFAENQLQETILAHWQKHLSDTEIKAISDWLASSLGRRFTLAEINASMGDNDSAMASYFEQLRAEPPSPKRIELLRLLDTAVRASAATTDMGININLAAVSAQFASGQAPEHAKTPAQQAKSHESDRGLIRAMIRQDVLRYYLFSYRNFDDQALRQYIAFAESPAGAKYHESTFFAVKAAMNKATQELQQQLQGQRQASASY